MSPAIRLRDLDRLRQMPVREIAGRGRQEASKWWDRVATDGLRAATARRATGGRTAPEAFRPEWAARFFAGAVDDRTAARLSEHLPEARQAVLARADKILQGRFDLLGYRDLSFGDPIDWHFDPVSGRHAPRVHWTRLDPLDHASIGDSKVLWELNRHQWFVRLGQAYRITGDERYAAPFASTVRDWVRANPVGSGINWASSLEASLRLVSWCWALVLFRGSAALTPELFARASAVIWAHAAHVARYLSHYFSPNTHLTGEALGLVYVGVLFPHWRRVRRWSRAGLRILVEQSERQVHADGVYFEQSACYQRYTVEIYLHLLLLAERSRIPVPPAVAATVQRMLDALLTLRRPDGSVPQIGDSDGGWLLPLADRAADDHRGVFAVAAALFGRADYAWAAGGLAPEALWLLGPAAHDSWRGLSPQPPARRSHLLPAGGYAVMRNGWAPDAHQLVFDVGPLGCPYSAGHGHADLLSIQCSAFGRPFLVDAGTGSYADPPWRNYFRNTVAHSTVVVDGTSQATAAGPFAWRHKPQARLRRWISNDSFDFADAAHDGYLRLADPVRHRRRVVFVKPRFWLLIDDLEGREAHELDLRFQFGAAEATVEEGSRVRATAGGRALVLCPVASGPLQVRVSRGRRDPLEGWWSPDYGQRRPASVVVYSARPRLPFRIVTLLLPVAEAAGPVPSFVPLWGARGELSGVALGSEGERIDIDGLDDVPVHRPPRGQGA
jgi:hypothetical protein